MRRDALAPQPAPAPETRPSRLTLSAVVLLALLGGVRPPLAQAGQDEALPPNTHTLHLPICDTEANQAEVMAWVMDYYRQAATDRPSTGTLSDQAVAQMARQCSLDPVALREAALRPVPETPAPDSDAEVWVKTDSGYLAPVPESNSTPVSSNEEALPDAPPLDEWVKTSSGYLAPVADTPPAPLPATAELTPPLTTIEEWIKTDSGYLAPVQVETPPSRPIRHTSTRAEAQPEVETWVKSTAGYLAPVAEVPIEGNISETAPPVRSATQPPRLLEAQPSMATAAPQSHPAETGPWQAWAVEQEAYQQAYEKAYADLPPALQARVGETISPESRLVFDYGRSAFVDPQTNFAWRWGMADTAHMLERGWMVERDRLTVPDLNITLVLETTHDYPEQIVFGEEFKANIAAVLSHAPRLEGQTLYFWFVPEYFAEMENVSLEAIESRQGTVFWAFKGHYTYTNDLGYTLFMRSDLTPDVGTRQTNLHSMAITGAITVAISANPLAHPSGVVFGSQTYSHAFTTTYNALADSSFPDLPLEDVDNIALTRLP
ncbi:MAG: hypothetical protein H6673_10085 [Anaerolineales bacterium]|nr:hypothetical protein [Anaerolineales bacterium]